MKYNIDGKFPVMANWLTFRRIEDDLYEVVNGATDRVLILNESKVRFLRALNGDRDPVKIARMLNLDVENVMVFLEEELLVRDSRTIRLDEMSLRTVYIPHRRTSKSIFPQIYNMLLLLPHIVLHKIR